MLVGFSSLGSFSGRFRELVGESPSAYRTRWAAAGGPHISGCYLFMWGVRPIEQPGRSATDEVLRTVDGMITNVSLVTLYCTDQDATRDFYVDVLGFETRSDVAMEGFRWVTVGHPRQPELEITLMTSGSTARARPPSSSGVSSARGRWAVSACGSTTAARHLRGTRCEGCGLPAGAR